MADKKITQLTNITGANLAEADEFVVVDITADETKAITFSELKTAFDTGTGFVRITGDTMTGNLSFGDNDKAIFGAGSDLQIYHNGTDSYVSDAGTGILRLNSNGTKILMETAGGETLAEFINNGNVVLYSNDEERLRTNGTGIDVTGTVTSDGLTVDSGTASPIINLSRSGTYSGITFSQTISNNTGAGADLITYSSNNDTGYSWQTKDSGGTQATALLIAPNRDISFYEDTGTTPKFFWDAADELLGIGSYQGSTINAPLNLKSDANHHGLSIEENNGTETWQLGVDVDGDLNFHNSGGATPSVTFDDSGNVGIGTSSPSRQLHLSSSTPIIRLTDTDTNAYGEISSSSSDGNLMFFADQGNTQANTTMRFYVDASERMRIDSSGNLLVGTTDIAPSSDGETGFVARNSGYVIAGASGQQVMLLNRSGVDGDILQFRKSGSPVGSIGNRTNGLRIDKDNTKLVVYDDGTTNSFFPESSGDDVDLGLSSSPFKDLYLSGSIEIENGTGNVGVGKQALNSNTASSNTAVGYQAGYSTNNSAATFNTIFGYQAGYSNTSGSTNTFIGPYSGYSMTTGSNNTILGRFNGNQHGLDIRTSSNNIVLSDGDGKPHLNCFSDGRWYFGLSTTGNGHINLVGEFGSTYKAIEFQRTNGGSSVGSIVTNTSSTSYNTTSDHRLKENVDYTWDATTRLKLLKPARFNFIADADTTVDGFLAHEAQAVVPECVTGAKDAVDADGNPEYQGIDQSKLVPLLVKTIQELEARITTLENA